MNARLDLPGASVLPFQFPTLGAGGATPQEDGVPAPSARPLDNGVTPEPAAAGETPVDSVAQAAAALAEELARAHEEGLRRGLEEGREKGYAVGFAEGVKAGEAKLALEAERLAAIIGKLGAPLTALEQPVEEAVAALALEAARCVIGDGVKRSREFLVRLVREAIAKVPLEMGPPRVLLNPADLELVRKLVPEIEAGSAVLVADETIEAGGCLVVADGEDRQIKDRRWNPRTPDGVSQVNLTLSSRWRAVMLTLFDGGEEG